MARRPNVQSDRDNWGAVLNDYLDVSLNEDGRIKEDAVAPVLSPAIARGTTEAFAALDIWDGFDGTGGAAGSWDATTYAGWIAGIDSLLAGQISSGAVVKSDLGVASDETSHVYSYDAGDGPVNVLLIGGVHGAEILGQYAAMRWFEQFVSSNEVSCRQLRHAYRVTWIPTLNPSAYRSGRKNANGVDINRNFDLFWDRFSETDPESTSYKGPSAASEPETQMVASLLASGSYHVLLDCHNYTGDGDTFKIGLPGPHLLGPRQLAEDVYDRWKAVYGADISTDYLNLHNTAPTIKDYANYVMRHVQGRRTTGALTIECSGDLFGSTGASGTSTMTRPAARAYAGMIHLYLEALMGRAGMDTAIPYAYGYTSRQSSDLTPETNELTYMTLVHEFAGLTINTDTLLVPIAYAPALLMVEAGGFLSSGGTASRTSMAIWIDGESLSHWKTSVTTTATTGDAIPWTARAVKWIESVSNSDMPEVRVSYDHVTGTNFSTIQRTQLSVTVLPDTQTHPAPRVLGIP